MPTVMQDSTSNLEADLVRRFASGLWTHGLAMASGSRLDAFVVGHEIGLRGASQLGNSGSADLLVVTEDGRWWLIEAKLARSGECHPSFLFGNQLARYAHSMEGLGLAGLHPRLESYLYGRRADLRPPAELAARLAQVVDLEGALSAWCLLRKSPSPALEAVRLMRMLEDQLARRTITLAALVDRPTSALRQWIVDHQETRSVALLTVQEGRAVVDREGVAPLEAPGEILLPRLPPFNEVPQSYKPTPATLPLVLSDEAFSLYSRILEPRLSAWTGGDWPSVEISKVTSATFSLDLCGQDGREICLQIGRARRAGGEVVAGEHPLKFGVNMIWAAEQVYETWKENPATGEREYDALEKLAVQLCSEAGMLVRGIPRNESPMGVGWWTRLREKMRGDENRRPEVVVVREIGHEEGYAWPNSDVRKDEELLAAALEAVEQWLGEPPYSPSRRRVTGRRVPGMVK